MRIGRRIGTRGAMSAQEPRRWTIGTRVGITCLAGVLGLMTVVAVSGCEKPQAQAAPPPPAVTVARPLQREVSDWDEYPGRLAAPEAVDVRARVSGFIESAPFDEGALVKQGDLLFQIDARPFQAELNRTEAEVGRAEAQLRFATGEFQRF